MSMRYKITTPVAGFTGHVGAVAFANGVAEVEADADAPAMQYFRAQGYGIEELDAPATPEEPADPAALVAELEARLAAAKKDKAAADKAAKEKAAADAAAAKAAIEGGIQ